MMHEAGLIKYGGRTIWAGGGSECRLEFDFLAVWEYKGSVPDFDPAKLQFWHTHPNGPLFFSETDRDCIRGLNAAFGCCVFFGLYVPGYEPIAAKYGPGSDGKHDWRPIDNAKLSRRSRMVLLQYQQSHAVHFRCGNVARFSLCGEKTNQVSNSWENVDCFRCKGLRHLASSIYQEEWYRCPSCKNEWRAAYGSENCVCGNGNGSVFLVTRRING